MSTKRAKPSPSGFIGPGGYSTGEGVSRKKEGIEPLYIEPGKQFRDQLSSLPKAESEPTTVPKRFKRKLEPDWYGKCNIFYPFSDQQPLWDNSITIFPWLKSGDVVLITGYGRNCGFIEKLSDTLQRGKNFFGSENPYTQKEILCTLDERIFQSSVSDRIALVNNIPLDLMLPDDKKKFMDIVHEVKAAGNILICSFKDDYDFLRDMPCWDSVLEIRRGKKINHPDERYNISGVKFLRARHLSVRQTRVTYRLITHVPSGRSGYDATKDIYFINSVTGYEELRECIVQLFELGRTADEIKKILETEDKIIISLPTLNKLKREWGLRTYRPEKKPRQKKVRRNQSDESSSSEEQI